MCMEPCTYEDGWSSILGESDGEVSFLLKGSTVLKQKVWQIDRGIALVA